MLVVKYEDILAEENIRIVRGVIAKDGVIIYPTDTLYGLGGNFLSPAVMAKIDGIKQRADMPYSAMVPGMAMIGELAADIPEIFHLFFKTLLPGKFTFLFPVSPAIDPVLVRGGDKIGIRIPAVPAMLELVERVQVPFITTSVNRSGDPPLNRPQDILLQFSGTEVALFIDAGDLAASKGSTILDITQSPIQCLRKGDDFHKLETLDLDFV